MKREMEIRQSMACMSLILIGSFANSALAVDWNGGGTDRNFNTSLNWTHDAVPTSEDSLIINGAYTVFVDGSGICNRLTLKNGAVLNLSQGSLDSSYPGNTRVDIIGEDSVGTVNQSGGTYSIGHRFHIGSKKGGNGIYNLTAGDLIVYRGGISALNAAGGSASLEIGGMGGRGLLNISGGRVLTRSGVTIGSDGIFSVRGTEATEIGIGSDNNCDGHWVQQAGSTLRVRVDESPEGVTKIFIDSVDGTGNDGNVIFEAGALLDVSFLGDKKSGRFVVMEWEGAVTDKGLKFASGVNANEWNFYIDEEKKCLVVESEMKKPLGLLISMR